MKPIKYDVKRIEQGIQDCVQTNTLQLLQFKGANKTKGEILNEVPVYINSDGVPLGSSIGHVAAYLIELDFSVTLHIADVQIFDKSWDKLEARSVVRQLKERRKYIEHPIYGVDEFKWIFDGYISFLEKGGRIKYPIFSSEYLYKLLKSGPFLAVVNYQFLNSESKYTFDIKSNKNIRDSTKGITGTHVVTVIGYQDEKFILADPDPEFGGIREVDKDLLVGSIYLAETDYDSLVITVV